MTTLIIYIATSVAFALGFIAGLALRHRDSEHHECQERYDRMRKTLSTQINERDAQIDQLLKGES